MAMIPSLVNLFHLETLAGFICLLRPTPAPPPTVNYLFKH
jgi:hypothetical protein